MGRDLSSYLFPKRRLAVPQIRISDRTQGYAPSLILYFIMKKFQNNFMVLMLTLMGTVVFSSCSSDDDDKPSAGSQSKSWFITLSNKELNALVDGFTTYDPLFKRQEIVDELKDTWHNRITDPNLFKSEYMNDEGRVTGLYFFDNRDIEYCNYVNLWHIVDDSTVEVYPCDLMYGDSKNIVRRMLHVGSWNYWGNIYYALTSDDEPWIYTYVKLDNKLIVSNDEIIHLYDDYVVMDGYSRKMMWFTPVDR